MRYTSLSLLLLVFVGDYAVTHASLRATSPLVGSNRQGRPPVDSYGPTSPQIQEPASLRSLHQQMLTMQAKIDTMSKDVIETKTKAEETNRNVAVLLRHFVKSSCADVLVTDAVVSKPTAASGGTPATGTLPGFSRQESMEGVYAIYPPSGSVKRVKCMHDSQGDPGWTVILLRQDGSVDFNRTYSEYREGFGNPDGEVWIGLDTLHEITSAVPHKLRVEIKDFGGKFAYADYASFRIGGATTHFKLSVGGYAPTSTAGDALEPHNGMLFSNKDTDHDRESKGGNCSREFGGEGGWWFNTCYHALGTGRYRRPSSPSRTSVTQDYGGVTWHPFIDVKKSAQLFKMMIKPVNS